MTPNPRDLPHDQRLPPPRLPWVYLGMAQLSLGMALAIAVVEPAALGDFYYHARAIGLVHLVTLGWISGSILGALYMVAPVALRTPLPTGRTDGIACGFYWFGVLSMASHFWISEYWGMVGAAGIVLAALCVVGARVVRPIAAAPIPWPIRLHLVLAFANLLLAGTVGTLVGIEKLGGPTLPGAPLDAVLAHAHVAALGWATMMVIGTGYRLLPMLLPATPLPASRMVASAVLMELGVLGLLLTLPVRSGWSWAATAAVVGALAAFGANVLWMLRNPKPSPKELQRPDLPMANALQAMAYLALAALLGTALLAMSPSQAQIRLAWVYGVVGLVGFLAQIVVGIGGRLFPMVSWMQGFVRSDFERVPVSQYRMQRRGAQAAVLILWSLAVPVLAFGLYTGRHEAIVVADLALLVALVLDAANRALVVEHGRPDVGTYRVTVT